MGAVKFVRIRTQSQVDDLSKRAAALLNLIARIDLGCCSSSIRSPEPSA
jgi:hypothetical protein